MPQTFDRWQAQQKANERQFVIPVLPFRSESRVEPSILLFEVILQRHDQRLIELSAWDRSMVETTPILGLLHECASEAGVHQCHELCGKHSVFKTHFPQRIRLTNIFARGWVS